MPLSIHQEKSLRRQAHHLKPIVWIGQKGISENLLKEVDNALEHHELIKIKIQASEKNMRNTIISAIAQEMQAHIVQKIGNIAVFYRENRQKSNNLLSQLAK